MSVIQKLVSDSLTIPRYTIHNLVTGKEYMVNVTHIRSFNFDSDYITPPNIATKDNVSLRRFSIMTYPTTT